MDDDQVQARLQGLIIRERPNRKCKAPTEDNEEVEVRIPAKRHNIDLDLLDDPFDEPQIHTLGKHDILGAHLDFVNQENARKNAKPVIETKKDVSMLVLDIEDSTFILEAVFAVVRNIISVLEFKEARCNPHWRRNITDLQAHINEVARLSAPPKPANTPPKGDAIRFLVKLIVI